MERAKVGVGLTSSEKGKMEGSQTKISCMDEASSRLFCTKYRFLES